MFALLQLQKMIHFNLTSKTIYHSSDCYKLYGKKDKLHKKLKTI